ncbi:MAG: FAD-dependent oxidoreductase [Oscillospiraceae bacterium]|nr:FAD-dependent oxidoreductase [Oscillospiraceae bacterium]
MPHRPNILKLATKISLESLTYTGITYNDPEYKILEPIVDDDMCEIMMHMRLEANRTAEEIARRAKKDLAFTQAQLDKLKVAGVVRTRKVDGQLCWYYPIWVPGIMEGVLSNREQCDRYPVLGECFEAYTRLRVAVLAPFMDVGMNLMRVIPVQSAIENNSRKASYDEVHKLIEDAWAVSVGPCSCRRARRLMGEGCGHLEDDMCMYLNDNAVNYSETGAHRLVSKKEAYEILKRAEDNGLVHELNVTPGYDDTTAICNCCSCSCFALRIASYFRAPDAIRTNYIAKVDKDKCVACGQCVENCQLNAVKLGQKLCPRPTNEERPPETPRNTLWSSKRYDPDYRVDRTDVMPEGTAPCKAACPAHVPVQGYIRLAAEGRYAEALELIKKEIPFPAVCGRICNKKCEEACTRGEMDAPVAIDEIKKFIAEQELSKETRFVPKLLNQIGKPYPEKIAVIGAGPAGLSCAYYLAVKGYSVTVVEKEKALGGMLTLGIPSFRLEKNVINAEIDVLRELGVKFRTGVEVGKDVTLDGLRADGFKAFYLAIGASQGAKLGITGEDLAGSSSGIDFLRMVNQGERPEIGDEVAVIGGGNVAMDVARTAVRLGAKVTVYYRRDEASMPADRDELAEAKEEGVSFRYLVAPVEIIGEERVTALKLEKISLGTPDPRGRLSLQGTGEFETVPVTAVLAATGQKVDLGGIDLKLGGKGTVEADSVTCQTAVPDVFAGGDVVTGPQFVIDAIAAGKEAAVSIHRFVHEGQTLILGRDRRDYRAFDKATARIPVDGFDSAPRQRPAHPAAGEDRTSFNDLRGTFTEEQMKAECARCLGCGTAVVDEYMCVGCGICTTKCRFDAIHLEKIHDADNQEYFHTLGRIVKNVPNIGINVVKKHLGKYGGGNA